MRTLTIFLLSLFSLPLALNAQSVDEMLQKVSAAIEAGQNGQAVSYFRQTIPLNIDRTEMYYWTNVDKNSEISSKLATELALAYKKKRNYDKAYLFYKELLQKDPNNVDCLETCAEMQVCRGQEKDALHMYEKYCNWMRIIWLLISFRKLLLFDSRAGEEKVRNGLQETSFSH